MKVRTLIKSCVSLALIPPEDVIMGFDQVCSASESFPEIECYLEYFEETWLGSPDRLGKRKKLLFSITLWNQYLRKEQSLTENRISGIRAGEILPVNGKVERHRQRLQQLLSTIIKIIICCLF